VAFGLWQMDIEMAKKHAFLLGNRKNVARATYEISLHIAIFFYKIFFTKKAPRKNAIVTGFGN
jgi:hypothetical protein